MVIYIEICIYECKSLYTLMSGGFNYKQLFHVWGDFPMHSFFLILHSSFPLT